MSRRKPQLFLTFFLVLLIFSLESRIVNAAEDAGEGGQKTEEGTGSEEQEDALTEE